MGNSPSANTTASINTSNETVSNLGQLIRDVELKDKEVEEALGSGFNISNSEEATLSSNEDEMTTARSSFNKFSRLQTDVTIMNGWLHKQTVQRGSTRNLKQNSSTWKNRFFSLMPGCLVYSVSTVDESYAKVDKIIATCETKIPVLLPGTDYTGYEFTLLFGKDQKIVVAVAAEEALTSWLTYFRKSSTMSPSEYNKEGWLMRFHPTKKTWNLRYFVIKNGVIQSHARTEKGYMILSNCTVSISSNSISGFFGFAITGPNANINVCTESEDTRSQWISAIDKEIKRLEESGEAKSLTDRRSLELSHKIKEVLNQEKMFNVNKEPSKFERNPKKCFILSIDGGGIRGIITTVILERLVNAFPDLIERFDFVAGCSNGGMVAMGLAFGYSVKLCRMLLETTGNIIFKSNLLSSKMNGAKFKASNLKLLCDMLLGDKKLKDAKMKVMVPGFLMDNHHPDPKKRTSETRIFHNLTKDEDTAEDLASDCLMRTASAPLCFPSYQQYVDGGFFANDPASLAVSLAVGKMGFNPKDVYCLSLGTGRVYHYYDDPTHDWGYVQWVPKITNCFWDGILMKTELICKTMLGDQYHRLDPYFSKEIPLDDPLRIPELTEIAKSVDISDTIMWIQSNLYADKYVDTPSRPSSQTLVTEGLFENETPIK